MKLVKFDELTPNALHCGEESKIINKKSIEDVRETVTEMKLEAEKTNLRKLGTDMNYKFKRRPVVWPTMIVYLHMCSFYGLYYCFGGAKLATVLWAITLTILNNQAIVLTAHRAYSHRSFKLSKTLQLALMFFQTMAGQFHIIWWARDHRVHHKYSDTDADPYNASRGFYFAHFDWLMVKKHPLVLEKSRQIDISDLMEDDLLTFQRRYYYILYAYIGILFPWLIPYYLWNEDLWISFCVAYCLRLAICYHTIWSINSFAHMYGTRPVDKRILPVQSKLVHWLTGGDGWHNFHHCFPWDYGLSEFGYGKGLSTRAIEFFAKYGFAYDLKKASVHVVRAHSKRHGDGTHIL